MYTYDCTYFKLFSAGWLPLIETHSSINEMGVWKHTILFSLYSVTKSNCAAKILFTVQLLRGKKKLLSSSFKLFHLVQIRIYSCKRLRGKKKIIWNLLLPVQFSPFRQHKGQIPHSLGTESNQMPEVWPRVGRKSFDLIAEYFSNARECRECLLAVSECFSYFSIILKIFKC